MNIYFLRFTLFAFVSTFLSKAAHLRTGTKGTLICLDGHIKQTSPPPAYHDMWPFSGGERNIDRSSASAPSAGVEVQEGAAGIDKCPVDHETRSAWLAQNGKGASSGGESKGTTSALAFLSASGGPSVQGTVTVDRGGSSSTSSKLSVERVVSSIPRFGASDRRTESLDQGGHASETSTADPSTSPNWVYPSPAQFFSAMTRKNHNPQAEDMDIVVPIHNAVNERAWQQILEWERMADAQSWKTCGGPQLVSFKGRPKDLTWRAWVRSLMG